MIHWPRYVGAWRAKTARLSLAQKGAYSELLDELYASESPLPADLDSVCRIVGAISKEERSAVEFVLKSFFTLTDDGYTHGRAIEEIAKFRNISEVRSGAARASWLKRGQRKPPTNGKHPPAEFVIPEWVPADAWNAWLEVRKKKRAPNTPHALTLALGKLDTLRTQGHTPKAVLDQSTLRAYTGLFPLSVSVGDRPDYSAVIEKLEREDR